MTPDLKRVLRRRYRRECASERHCGVCRDRDGGAQWRAALLRYFGVAPSERDFECPTGKTWGYQPSDGATERRSGEATQRRGDEGGESPRAGSRRAGRRLEICRACEFHGAEAGEPCRRCWCKRLVEPNGEPDRLAYRLVLAGDLEPPAGCRLAIRGASDEATERRGDEATERRSEGDD